MTENEGQQGRLSDLFWKEALDSARQGVWDYDVRTGLKTHSATWHEIRGLKPGETPHESDEAWLAAVHPEDRALAREQTERLNAGELAEVNYEYRERHAEGHWMWIMCRGRPIAWDETGRPYRFIGTDTDITPLKQSEERVAAMSRRLELALSAGEFGIFTVNLRSQRLDWDRRLRAIYGLPTDDSPVPRDAWERALHPEDFARATSISYAAVEGRHDYGVDYRIIRSDGAVRHIRSRVNYQDDPLTGPLLVGINWDVTAEHERARALQEANTLAAIRNAELEAARAEMEYNALHDALTGLPNRRMLEKVQRGHARQYGRSVAPGRHAAVLHIDLDRFKQINDVFGHDVGDFVLKNTAEILREMLVPGAVVARVGGDEFAIFVPDAPPEAELARWADRLIARIAQPVTHAGTECRYGVSIGIATGPGAGGRDLFINADIALYRAKADGRGRARFFTDQMRQAAAAQKQLADEIMAGIERDEFFCVYQPQFDAATGAVSGVEALVRWNSSQRGPLNPSGFLDAAEDLDVLARIDRIVLDRAVADFNAWAAAGLQVPRLSVNLSKARLRQPGLGQELQELGMPHGRLSFELLESNYLDDQPEVVAANLAAIRALGIGIEVDDFGTGHASIVSLLKLRPARLKIDRALVAPVESSPMQAKLLRSIVEIGHLQGIAIIAEGVESEAQRAMLLEMGVDELQGYAMARPMTADELADFLRRSTAPDPARPTSAARAAH